MTGQELIDYILDNGYEDEEVFTACQGYTSLDDPEDELVTSVAYVHNRGIVIGDSCVIDGYRLSNVMER